MMTDLIPMILVLIMLVMGIVIIKLNNDLTKVKSKEKATNRKVFAYFYEKYEAPAANYRLTDLFEGDYNQRLKEYLANEWDISIRKERGKSTR